MADFKLEIISQRWLSDTPDGSYERGQRDSCSHGSVYCEIAGTKISSDDDEYGISQSALALLRTVDNDRVETDLDRNVPFDYGFLLCHGCGYRLSFGCTNFGTNWWVRHDGEDVVLSDPLLIDATSEPRVVRFDVTVRVP